MEYVDYVKEKEQYYTRDSKLNYFILSVAWRCLRYTYETEILDKFTEKEKSELESILEHWRYILYKENLKEISEIQMHIIPTKKLSIFNNLSENLYNNVSEDFRAQNEENTFKYAYQYVKVPYFILVCTVWGKTSDMKQFLVGKNILVKDSRLPEWLKKLIFSHLEDFKKSKKLMSAKQKEKIKNKVKE